jgi:pyrroline-5-carboxylate reductase
MAYGVLGVGAIGAAIVTGLCEDVDDPPRVLLSPRNAEIAAGLAQRFASGDVAPDNQAVVDGAQVVIVCVRPQAAQSVLAELRFAADRVVVSAMARVSVKALQRLVAPATDIARVIPLPSVARRDGLTPVHPPNAAATALFDRLGEAVELADVEAFEALSASTATSTTGSSPAASTQLENKVAATPMTAWGETVAPRHVRFVYSNEPVERLAALGERVRAAPS